MDKTESSRKKFLQLVGLSAGATLVTGSLLANESKPAETLKLNEAQQEFMNRYEKWMNEFSKVISIQKTDPDNMENQKTMIALTEMAEEFKPQLAEFMQDGTFAFIFRVKIEKLTREISA